MAEEIVRTAAILPAADRERGFSAILDIELDRAYRVAGHILGDSAEAEDATQEALAKAWASWQTLRTPDAAQGWFWRILVNGCRSRLRARKNHGVRDIVEAEDIASADPFVASLARDVVGRAMTALNDDQRITVVLRFWGDLTVPEIADRMRVRPGTVKSRLHAALSTMRRDLERRGEAQS
jgi:RNA polymerase sigma-70 factor (ECF subfamily)